MAVKKYLNIFLLLAIISSCNNSKVPEAKRKPIAGGTLQMMLHPPYTLDPLFVKTSHECCLVEQIYNGLLKFDINLNPLPDLAESWSFSEDKKKITFIIKKGVLFHNGRELTAHDVVYSFTRIFYPDLQVPTSIKNLFSSVEGVAQFERGETDSISGFAALDDYTFQIRLIEPNSSLLTILAVIYFKIIPRDNSDLSRNPIGTGPFKFNFWRPQQLISLKKNNYYFDEKANLDKINFIITEEESDADVFKKFRNEKLDILDISNRLDIIPLVTDKYTILRRLKLGISFIGFNLQKPPFDKLEVRQAIAHAINREAILYQRNIIANGIFPVGMPGYQPQQKCYPYNPSLARQLLSQIKDPTSLKRLEYWAFVSDTSEVGMAMHKTIQNNLREIGIDLKLKAVTYKELVSAIKNSTPPMFCFSLIAEIPLPEEFLANYFQSDSENNFFQYRNREVDLLIKQSRREFDLSQKINLLQLAEQKIIHDVPVIPLFYTSNLYLIQNYVHGIEMGPLGIVNLPMEKIWKTENQKTLSGIRY